MTAYNCWIMRSFISDLIVARAYSFPDHFFSFESWRSTGFHKKTASAHIDSCLCVYKTVGSLSVTFHLPENRNTKIETTKRNLISDDFEQSSVKLVISVDSKSVDFSGAGSWCFEAETEETTTTIVKHLGEVGELISGPWYRWYDNNKKSCNIH